MASIYRSPSIGNAVNIVVVKLLALEKKGVNLTKSYSLKSSSGEWFSETPMTTQRIKASATVTKFG